MVREAAAALAPPDQAAAEPAGPEPVTAEPVIAEPVTAESAAPWSRRGAVRRGAGTGRGGGGRTGGAAGRNGTTGRIVWPDEVLGDGSGRRWAAEADLLLAERAALTPQLDAAVEVALPGHLSVSQLVALRRDPQRLARSLRRPLPRGRIRMPAGAPRSTTGWSSGSGPSG